MPILFEPTTGIEPVTSSLPRKRSTPELRRLVGQQVLYFNIKVNFNLDQNKKRLLNFFERETGFEPATFSLEG